jgi:uncharacterized protein YlxW (UPF0749 family)
LQVGIRKAPARLSRKAAIAHRALLVWAWFASRSVVDNIGPSLPMKPRKLVFGFALVCAGLVVNEVQAAAKLNEAPKKEQQEDLAAQLVTEKKKLAELLRTFTEQHPKVKAERQKIAALEAELAERNRKK